MDFKMAEQGSGSLLQNASRLYSTSIRWSAKQKSFLSMSITVSVLQFQ